MADITLWLPEKHLIIHQALGKAAEEAAELSKNLARCLIQGIDASDPKTGQSNREQLLEEIADLDAAVQWLREVADLGDYLDERADRKLAGFRFWQHMLRESEAEATAPAAPEPQEIPGKLEMFEGKLTPVVDASRSGWWRFHEHYDRNGYCDNPGRGY